MLRILPGGPECVRRDVRLRRRERERRTTRDRIGDQSQAGGGTREVICTFVLLSARGLCERVKLNGTRAPRVHAMTACAVEHPPGPRAVAVTESFQTRNDVTVYASDVCSS